MTRMLCFAAALVAAGAISLAAQGTISDSHAIAESHTPPDYVIGIGDVLQVVFWRDKDLSAEVMVRPDGKITLPLLNEIEASGMTPEQLRLAVIERANRFVDDPRANVIIKEINSRNVYIIGQVTKQGTYPLLGPTSVLQLIATAGGVTEFASGDYAFILRNAAGRQMSIKFNYKSALKGQRLAQIVELSRRVAGVLEDAIGDAQVLGDVRVVVQRERLAGAGQVVEFAALDRLGDFLFCDLVEHGQ